MSEQETPIIPAPVRHFRGAGDLFTLVAIGQYGRVAKTPPEPLSAKPVAPETQLALDILRVLKEERAWLLTVQIARVLQIKPTKLGLTLYDLLLRGKIVTQGERPDRRYRWRTD